jgi:hypothetical protein
MDMTDGLAREPPALAATRKLIMICVSHLGRRSAGKLLIGDGPAHRQVSSHMYRVGSAERLIVLPPAPPNC